MMALSLAIVALVMWGALVFYGEHAPLKLWKLAFLPLTVLCFLFLKGLVFIGSLGTKRIDFYVEDAA